MKYFLDTNIIIDLMDNKPWVMDKLKNLWQEHEVFISDIVYYEILRGFKYKEAERKLKVFHDFCKHIPVVYQSYESIVIAAENYALLKRSGILIEDDDILIGAVAIAHNGILVTNNARPPAAPRKKKTPRLPGRLAGGARRILIGLARLPNQQV